ncbi:hypothetical protein J3Q64DRAFT_1752750 [Phycomyces blakesleeanus]|uniref:NADH:flavin oxidoreductase/NADH oxidase N-terminal domain-containing protein n=2 Tax=Phycomyces blakesleeanus TaxID=4837 RepID=A0A163DRB2_PHYB8|nr:hypothetical protein PHYBLDRAFT_20800 [Phycomyces blakesleeanus NRRL 1555(-)]OAD72960.1 hypothetical protein PHYBLDRAFT_20800 [Phycomyces blakesleeanus NRRL 1555(-)]|eukprot:XP_018291000.1 hypothetical protein PHYBLDRAFT_20800 [Phycomyces blakesleeanus NRRL 1555(-)]
MATALFMPIKVGTSLLSHRVVHSPMTRLRADSEHAPSPLMAEYYEQRASEGGLIIVEGTFINEENGIFPFAPGIYNDKQIEAWKVVTKAVHNKGGIIYLQLCHPGRAAPSIFIPGKRAPVSSSAISINGKNAIGATYDVPRALEVEEISKISQAFAQAAKNSISAGFDGVEIHGSNGFLIDQFINTSSNTRTDQYGGSIENRTRFALEVVESVTKAIGDDRTGIRLSPWSGYQDMKDDTPYKTWGYISSKIQERYPKMAYLHFIEPRDDYISGPNPGVDRMKIIENDTIEPFRKAWKGPFITSGGYTTTPKRAFETAEQSNNILVSFGRSFVANPDLVLRLKNDWPLNKYDRSTFYGGDSTGYTDYSFYKSDTDNDITN